MARPRQGQVLDEAAFSALYQRLRNAAAWGPDDRRGALNYITQAQVIAAASEIRLGRTLTLAAALDTRLTMDNPEPCVHEMTSPPGDQADPSGLSFATDRIAMNVHGDADSHIDAMAWLRTPSPPPAPLSCPSRWPATASRAAASCSTSRGYADCAGWSLATT